MSRLVEGIMETLFPGRCVFCRRFLRKGESVICAECEKKLPRRSPERTPGPEFVEAIDAPLEYTDAQRRAMERYKFGGATAYAGYFGRLVAESVRANLAGEYDLISWVPLSKERLTERGYDQAMLIAMAAALELGDVAVETLRRTRNAAPQSHLSGDEDRRANISGAFAVTDPELVAGKRVLLIDDIATSGSTASECARVLGLAGAAEVYCGVVAN